MDRCASFDAYRMSDALWNSFELQLRIAFSESLDLKASAQNISAWTRPTTLERFAKCSSRSLAIRLILDHAWKNGRHKEKRQGIVLVVGLSNALTVGSTDSEGYSSVGKRRQSIISQAYNWLA